MKQEADSRDGDDAKRNERFVIFKEEDEDGREMVTEEERVLRCYSVITFHNTALSVALKPECTILHVGLIFKKISGVISPDPRCWHSPPAENPIESFAAPPSVST